MQTAITGSACAAPDSAALDSAAPDSAAPELDRRLLPFVVLIAALSAGMVMQGGYRRHQFVPLLVLVAVAMVSAIATRTLTLRSLRSVPVLASAVLTAGLIVSAVGHGDFAATVPALALCAAVMIAMLIGRQLPESHARAAVDAMIAMALGVAATAWFGLATHSDLWARQGSQWRGSSVLTYENAGAAVAVIGVNLALGRLADRDRSVNHSLVVTGLLVGLAATGSRAGVIGLTVGGLVLLATLGPRKTISVSWIPALGAIPGALGVLASSPQQGNPRPGLAVASLAAGLFFVFAAHRRPKAATGAVILLAVLGAMGPASDGVSFLTERATATSVGTAESDVTWFGDRAHEWSAAWSEVNRSPFVGVGPADLQLSWVAPDGVVYRAQYVHNEYLELFATHGMVGLAAVAIAIGALAGAAKQRVVSASIRGTSIWATRAGLIAAIASFVVHSAFDYLWHIPVLPTFVALLTGLLLAPVEPFVDPIGCETGP